MKLAEIEERLAQVDVAAGQDLIYELLAAYGTPQASITKLRTGTYNKSNDPDVVLWKRKVWDTYQPEVDESELIALVDRAQADGAIAKLKPRFVIARSDQRLVAVDSRIGQSLDIELSDLPQHAAFFMPWTGAEKVRSETISYVDTKVAQQMAKLYDEIVATNTELPASDDGRRDLNVFFSRLLFCFFAEDTGVFEDGIFTDGLNQLTATDGSDTADFLDQLFVILDTAPDDRGDVPAHFGQFGYVNGSLFADRIVAPIFSRKARNIVVDCGTLDWSSINPDIFGSMIQAVTAGEDRSALGMHYTSVENILKVLNPLFLDDLEERYEDAQDSVRKLEKLHEHLGGIKVFDPACGSGNFLIVAYKRLRTIEHRILQRLVDLDAGNAPLFADSKISLENFFGIEIDDFAHDIAKLSLWFAKHQMNQHYDDIFGIERPLIPLTETGAIFCGNAVQLDWPEVCPPTEMTYLCGNPPFVGSKNQTTEQRADFATYFSGQSYSKELDYVCLWFLKGADYINLKQTSLGFVSTNSTCQGRHVPLFLASHFGSRSWNQVRSHLIPLVEQGCGRSWSHLRSSRPILSVGGEKDTLLGWPSETSRQHQPILGCKS
ncbi:N-6 DNA methylase [Acidimicrobiales bacterium]|nr:N-6 DNA methylase [Acidimicrobiales bacterium]